MKNRKNQMAALAAAGILTVCLVAGGLAGCGKKEVEARPSSQRQSQADANTIEWKGKRYTYNNDLTNILFLGIDKSEQINDSYAPGDAGQADCIMLLSLDQTTDQARILQINRNTMTKVDIYDVSGNYYTSIDSQLATQYGYSIGGASSSWAMEKTVSELLYNVPIDGYFSMDMSGIAEINDALGQVTVTMAEDYTEIDPAFEKGASVKLTGDQAERFLRYRDTDEFNSNEGRMHRQVEYITAMLDTVRNTGGRQLYDILSPYLDTYIVTDMDAEQLNAFASYEYLTDDVSYLPGETVQGEIYEEFYVDEEALQDEIIHTFYKEVKS